MADQHGRTHAVYPGDSCRIRSDPNQLNKLQNSKTTLGNQARLEDNLEGNSSKVSKHFDRMFRSAKKSTLDREEAVQRFRKEFGRPPTREEEEDVVTRAIGRSAKELLPIVILKSNGLQKDISQTTEREVSALRSEVTGAYLRHASRARRGVELQGKDLTNYLEELIRHRGNTRALNMLHHRRAGSMDEGLLKMIQHYNQWIKGEQISDSDDNEVADIIRRTREPTLVSLTPDPEEAGGYATPTLEELETRASSRAASIGELGTRASSRATSIGEAAQKEGRYRLPPGAFQDPLNWTGVSSTPVIPPLGGPTGAQNPESQALRKEVGILTRAVEESQNTLRQLLDQRDRDAQERESERAFLKAQLEESESERAFLKTQLEQQGSQLNRLREDLAEEKRRAKTLGSQPTSSRELAELYARQREEVSPNRVPQGAREPEASPLTRRDVEEMFRQHIAMLNLVRGPQQMTDADSGSAFQGNRHRFHLVEIEKFTGDEDQYPSFRQNVELTVARERWATDKDKALFLLRKFRRNSKGPSHPSHHPNSRTSPMEP